MENPQVELIISIRFFGDNIDRAELERRMRLKASSFISNFALSSGRSIDGRWIYEKVIKWPSAGGQIEAFIKKLRSRSKAIAHLRQQYDSELCLGIVINVAELGMPTFDFHPEVIATLSDLGMPLSVQVWIERPASEPPD